MKRRLLLATLPFALAACGFHLKGAQQANHVHSIYLDLPGGNDELADAIRAALRQQGIVCLPHAGDTPGDGLAAFRQALAAMPEHERARVTGYCFFHGQDLARALSDHLLWLTFGPHPQQKPPQQKACAQQTGRLIAAALENEGLRAEWSCSGSSAGGERICVQPFTWQRRIG